LAPIQTVFSYYHRQTRLESVNQEHPESQHYD